MVIRYRITNGISNQDRDEQLWHPQQRGCRPAIQAQHTQHQIDGEAPGQGRPGADPDMGLAVFLGHASVLNLSAIICRLFCNGSAPAIATLALLRFGLIIDA